MKINARVMIRNNTVTNVVIDQTAGNISIILVAFDSEPAGQEARYTSVYHSINQNAVPIH